MWLFRASSLTKKRNSRCTTRLKVLPLCAAYFRKASSGYRRHFRILCIRYAFGMHSEACRLFPRLACLLGIKKIIFFLVQGLMFIIVIKVFVCHQAFYYFDGDAVRHTQNGRLRRYKEKYYSHIIAEIWKSEKFRIDFSLFFRNGAYIRRPGGKSLSINMVLHRKKS